jgi:valyl-tRNA synthetase
MPFVTEKLWLSMPHEGKSIMTAAYPEAHAEFDNAKADEDMAFLIEIIKGCPDHPDGSERSNVQRHRHLDPAG